MRRTMHYIVAMAAALWMAMPQVKAQKVNEDFDPGIMYIKRNEGMHINFQEGNEWEITFTALDTLGNEYYSPVAMEIKGGVYGDSTYVMLQTIDSILMYQPEPKMQKGVFVITEEYFPYIVQVDSTTTIHFNDDLPLPLPQEGQKVVCNIFEEPLRNGFIGTVIEKRREGDIIIMECDPTVKRLRDFYQEFIYCGKGGETKEETEARERIERTHRVRRGVVVKAPSKEEDDKFKVIEDPDFNIPISFKVEKKMVDIPAKKEDGDDDWKELHDYAKGKGEGKAVVSANASIEAYLQGLLTIIADKQDEKVGLELAGGLKVKGSFGFNGEIEGALAIPFGGRSLNKTLPGNTGVVVAVGFFLRGKVGLDIALSADVGVDGYIAFQYDEEKGLFVTCDGKAGLGDIAGLTGELSGEAAFSCGVLGDFKFLGKKAEFNVYLDGTKFDGKMAGIANLNTNEEKPSELYDQYKAYTDVNRVQMKSGITAEMKMEIKGQDIGQEFKVGGEVDFSSVTYGYAPVTHPRWSGVQTNAVRPEHIVVRMINDGHSLFPADAELWIYDEDQKMWANKIKAGKIGAIKDSDFDFTFDVDLEKGHTYTICPVYKPVNSNMYMSDNALIEKLYIPYSISMEKPEYYNHDKVTLRAVHEVVDKPNTKVGFLYKDKTSGLKELEVTEKGGGKIETKIDMPTENYEVMAFMEVDGKRSLSESYEMEPLARTTPIMLYPTDITYNSATFHMQLPEDIEEKELSTVAFTYNCAAYDQPIRLLLDPKDIQNGIISGKVENLLIATEYTVYASTIAKGGISRESQESHTFTTKSPITDIQVTPSYSSATMSCIAVNYFDMENISVKFLVSDSRKFDKETTQTITASLEETEKGVMGTGVVTGLDMTKDYYYKMELEIQSWPNSEFYESDIYQFKTLDGLTVAINKPVVKSTSVTLKGEVTDYLLELIQKGTPYTGRFYFSKSKASVTALNSDFIDVTLNKQEVETELEGLISENKYYCMFVVEQDGKKVCSSEIISFTTPDIYQVTTKEAEVEDATVTLNGEMTQEAYDEIKSKEHNTIYAGFEYSTNKEDLINNNMEGLTRLIEVDVKGSSSSYVPFEHTLDMEPGTFYYYRAFIYVDGKDYSGSIKTFQTLEYDGGLIPWAKRKFRVRNNKQR